MHMFDGIVEAAINIFRIVMWFFASFILKLMDWLYEVVQSFFGLQLSEFDWIWNWYWVICAMVGVFILLRILVMLFQAFYNDDAIQKLNGVIVNRMIMVFLVITLIPVIMPTFSTLASESAQLFPKIISTEDVKPSDIIIEASCANFEDGNLSTSTTLTIPDDQHAIDYITTDNLNDKEGDAYLYFKNTMNIALAMVLSCFAGYCFFFVCLQIISRLGGLMMKILIAPYAVTGLINPNDNSCETWFKLCMADFLTAFFQSILIWLALWIPTHLPEGINGLAKGIVFLGSVFAIMNAPAGIAQLLGGDVGSSAGLQANQMAQMFTGGISTAVKVTGVGTAVAGGAALAGSIAQTGTALGVYTAGRKLGARTLNPNNLTGGSGGIIPPSGQGGESSGGSGNPTTLSAPIGGNGDGATATSSYSGNNEGGASPSVQNISQMDNMTGFAEQAVESVTASLGQDGILHYSDNRVTDNYQAKSALGGMVSSFGNHIYTAAGRQIFTTKKQRQANKPQTTFDRINQTRNSLGNLKASMQAGSDRAKDIKWSKEFRQYSMNNNNRDQG